MTGGLRHSARARIAHISPFRQSPLLRYGPNAACRCGSRAEGEDGITGTTPTLAALLRHHRLAAGFTQEGLAEAAGLSARGVQDLERGVSTKPRADTIRMLAEALGLDAEARAGLIAAVHPELAVDVAEHSWYRPAGSPGAADRPGGP